MARVAFALVGPLFGEDMVRPFENSGQRTAQKSTLLNLAAAIQKVKINSYDPPRLIMCRGGLYAHPISRFHHCSGRE